MVHKLKKCAVAGIVSMGVIAGAVGVLAQQDPPRRDEALPGLDPMDLLVDPDESWYSQAMTSLERARRSFVIVQDGDNMGYPPLSGFLIGPSHVATAHLSELVPGAQPRRFRLRFIDGQIRDGVQVAGWSQHDFGVIKFEEPVDLPPIEFGDETKMQRDEVILNIGNPGVAARTGLVITSAGRFIKVSGSMVVVDISTSAGGSGGPILDLEGKLIGMASTGVDIAVVGIDEMKVADLSIRNSFPFDRGGGEAGVTVSVLRRLTSEYQQ